MSIASEQVVPAPSSITTADAAVSGESRGRRTLRVVLPPFIVFLIVLGLWALASEVLLDEDKRFLLPPWWSVVNIGFLDSQNAAEIFSALWLTTRAALLGFALSIVIGMALGIVMSQAKWIERSLFPYAVVLQVTPILALVPLIGFTLGFDFSSRVLVCVLIALFPVITNTLFGLLSVDRGQHDLFTLHGASRWTRLTKLQLPAAMPAIFTGFRIAAGASVVGAVVGDFFFKQGKPGIGQLIDLYSSQLESERLYAAVIASCLLGVVFFVLVGVVNNRVVGRWHESAGH